MRNDDLCIDPIKWYGAGQCPKCGSLLYVADMEANYMVLNKNGIPTDFTTEIYRCDGICQKCESKYEMLRDGSGYRITYPEGSTVRRARMLSKLDHNKKVGEA